MGVADAVMLAATAVAASALLYQLYSLTLDPKQRRGLLEGQVIGPLTWPPITLLIAYAAAIAASFYASSFYRDVFTFANAMIWIASGAQSQIAKRNKEGYTWAAVIVLLIVVIVILSAFLHVPPFGPGSHPKSTSSAPTALEGDASSTPPIAGPGSSCRVPQRGMARSEPLCFSRPGLVDGLTIWAAYRDREVQKGHATGRRSRRHVALVALHTGTRAGAICCAAFKTGPG